MSSWPTPQGWLYTLGATNLGAAFATLPSGKGFSSACTDSLGDAWLCQYSGNLYNVPHTGAAASAYALPASGIFTGCAFAPGIVSGAIYCMSSDGRLYTPNLSTKTMRFVGTFGTTPTWTLAASGSTLFTLGARTTLETFTLSSIVSGTPGTIAGTPANLTALNATTNAVAVGGYAFATLASGFTAVSYNAYSPVMLAVNHANNAVQLWGDTYGENWTYLATLSVTAPTSCAWAGQNTALVSASGIVQVIVRNNALINLANSITVANAGALAVSPDFQTALVCQGASNTVAVLGTTSTIWGSIGSITGLTNPACVATTAINLIPIAFIGFANGLALAQFSNGVWSVSKTASLTYSPKSVFVDSVLNRVYVCGTASGSGQISVFDTALNAVSNVSYTGSADSIIEANAQITVADATNSSIHVSDGASIKNTYASVAGVNYLSLSAITVMATNATTTNLYSFTAPYQLEPIRFGQVAYRNVATWHTVNLPNGHVPTAIGFDASGICWAATQLNSLYQINGSGTVVASGYQITSSPQPETTPLGISSFEFWNSSMYSGQSLFGSLIEGVTASAFNPPVSPLPPTFVVPLVPASTPSSTSSPPPAAPPPNYNTGAYFGAGGAGAEGFLSTFETTAGVAANSLYTMAFGPFSSSATFTGGGSTVSSFNNTKRNIVFGFPLCWTGTTPAQIAAGSFNSTITSLVSGLVPFKGQIASINLGWNPNASEGLPWQGVAATDYVNAFRHVVPLIRQQFATTPITWNVLAGISGSGGQTVVTLTDATQTTWTPPPGIVVLDKVECWGAGGQGAPSWNIPGAGGGGAYAAIINLAVTSGTPIAIQIGIGGQNTADNNFGGIGDNGTPTWFKSTATCYADFGLGTGGHTTNSSGAGGLATNCIGSTVFPGGAGGASSGDAGSGGGGAGGPAGAGQAGTSITGPGTLSGTGGAGDAGFGGGGGLGDTASAAATNGGTGTNFLGGGGGGGSQYFAGGTAGKGGLPGGGGGGDNINHVAFGFGGGGQIRITYSVPVASPTVYYPGDDVVDMVGTNIYESVITSYASALTATAGLNFLASMAAVTSGANAPVSGGHKIISLPLWSATSADSTFITSMAGWITANMQGTQKGGYQIYDNTKTFQAGAQSLVNFGSITGSSSCLFAWETPWGNTGGAAPPPVAPPAGPPTPPPSGTRTTLLGFYLNGPSGNISTWLGYHPDCTINNSYQDHFAGGAFFPLVGTGTPYPAIFDLDIVLAGMTYADVAAGLHDTDINNTLASIAGNSSYTGASIYGFRIDSEFNQHGTTWQGSGVPTFRSAFNRVAGLIHAVYPNAKIIYNPNVDPGLNHSGDVTTAWPSSADIFGVDIYFDPQYQGPTSTGSWATLFGSSGTTPTGNEGAGTLGNYITFAKSVHAPIGLPEWGDLYQSNGDFVALNNMIACCKTVSNNIVVACYWDSPDQLLTSAALSTGAQTLMKNGFSGAYGGTFWTFITPPTNFAGY